MNMVDNLSKNKKIARNTAFLYIRMVFVLVISLYTSRVILKILGIEDYGIFNVVAGFVSMFAFLNNSLNSCIQRFYNYEMGIDGERGVKRVFSTSCIIQILLAIVVLLLVESVGYWLLNTKMNIPIQKMDSARFLFHMSVFSMMLLIFQAPFSAAIMAYEKMDYYAIVGIVDIVLKLFIVLILPLFKVDSLYVYGLLLLFVSIIDFLFYAVYAICKIKPISFNISYEKKIFKEMLSFSGWSILGSFTQVIRNQGLNIVLNIFFGPTINAARGLSFQIKGALLSFTSNISVAARPQMVTSYAQGNINRSFNLLYSLSKITFCLLYLMVLPLAGEIEFILHLWLGASVPDYTSIFTVLIMVIMLIDTFNGNTTTIIYAGGNIKSYNILTSVIGLSVLPLAYFALTISNNPLLVYYISILISLLVLGISIYCQYKLVKVPIFFYLKKVLFPSSILVISTFWIPLFIRNYMNESFLRCFINIPICIVSVLIASYLFFFDQNEKKLIRDGINKTFKRNNGQI